MKLSFALFFVALTIPGLSAFAADATPIPAPPLPRPAEVQVAEKSAAAVPSPVDEVVRMADVGVSDQTILSYLDNSGGFSLSVEDVITLHQRGISEQVITAMLQHAPPPSAPTTATIVMCETGPNSPIIYPTPAREAVPLLSSPLVVYSSPYAYGYGQSSVVILGGSYYSGSHCYGGSRGYGYGGSSYGGRAGGYGYGSFGRCR